MDNQVVSPDQQDQGIDGQDPEHENEDGVCVVGEVEVCGVPLNALAKVVGIGNREGRVSYCLPGMPLCSNTGCELNNACNHVCKLVRDNSRHED